LFHRRGAEIAENHFFAFAGERPANANSNHSDLQFFTPLNLVSETQYFPSYIARRADVFHFLPLFTSRFFLAGLSRK
jgi:hypothetical protein